MVGQLSRQISYRGKWILTPYFELLPDAYVVCADNRIQQVTSNRPDGKIVEHEGLILPGLVNAHTHLEFSDLTKPLGQPGEPFVSWIGRVIKHRYLRDQSRIHEAIQTGLDESKESGTVAIGEISTFEWHSDVPTNLNIVDFRELIGFQPEQHPEITEKIKSLDSTGNGNEKCQYGLSPHAPYSLNRESLIFAVEHSRKQKLPLAMHLAESQEELELISSHAGPFFELLESLNLWTDSNFEQGTRSIDFLRLLVKSHRSLVIHGNYLDRPELEFVAENQSVLKLVYCPRTHNYFRHDPYPLDTISNLGIELALGTDSRASNPDLSVWNEMTFLQSMQSVSPRDILRMGTINGAESLGLQERLGSLEPGKQSNLFLAPGAEECDFVRAIVEEL